MTVQTINIGNQVNDGLGDDLRTAFQKVNSNFSELDASLTPTMSNLGTTGAGIFKQKLENNFQLKRLVAGRKMFINDLTDSIVIGNEQPNAFETITATTGVLTADTTANISIIGGADVSTSIQGSSIRINTVLPVTKILTDLNFGTIIGNSANVVEFHNKILNIDFGTATNPSSLNFDLGEI